MIPGVQSFTDNKNDSLNESRHVDKHTEKTHASFETEHSSTLSVPGAHRLSEVYRRNTNLWHMLSSLWEPCPERLHKNIPAERKFVKYAIFACYMINAPGRTQPHIPTTPIELFFDLIYVAATVRFTMTMSSTLYADPGSPDTHLFYMAFTALVFYWLMTVQITVRFQAIGRPATMLSNIFWGCYMFAIIQIAAYSTFHDTDWYARLLGAMLLSSILLAVAQLVFLNIPMANKFVKAILLERLFSILILIGFRAGLNHAVNRNLDDGRIYLTWFFSVWLIYKLVAPFILKAVLKDSDYVPLNIARFEDRYGEFFLVQIGETFITIMSTQMDWHDHTVAELVFAILVNLIGMNLFYFDYKPASDKYHGFSRNIFTSIGVYVANIIIYVGLLGFGVGQKLALKHVAKAEGWYTSTSGSDASSSYSTDTNGDYASSTSYPESNGSDGRRFLAGYDSYNKYSADRLEALDSKMINYSMMLILAGTVISWHCNQSGWDPDDLKREWLPTLLIVAVIIAVPLVLIDQHDNISLLEQNWISVGIVGFCYLVSKLLPQRSLLEFPAVSAHGHGHGDAPHLGMKLHSMTPSKRTIRGSGDEFMESLREGGGFFEEEEEAGEPKRLVSEVQRKMYNDIDE